MSFFKTITIGDYSMSIETKKGKSIEDDLLSIESLANLMGYKIIYKSLQESRRLRIIFKDNKEEKFKLMFSLDGDNIIRRVVLSHRPNFMWEEISDSHMSENNDYEIDLMKPIRKLTDMI